MLVQCKSLLYAEFKTTNLPIFSKNDSSYKYWHMLWLWSSENDSNARLDRSEDASVHVSTCTWFQRMNASCVEVVALIRHEFLRLVAKKKRLIGF